MNAAATTGNPSPALERFLPWHADPRNLRAWAQPPPPGQPHRNSRYNGVTANTVTPPAGIPNHGTSEYLPANRTLSVASEAGKEREHGPRHAREAVPSSEWETWLREFHRLLAKIAVKHAEVISWSVSVGTDFSLTVNFATAKDNPAFRDQDPK